MPGIFLAAFPAGKMEYPDNGSSKSVYLRDHYYPGVVKVPLPGYAGIKMMTATFTRCAAENRRYRQHEI